MNFSRRENMEQAFLLIAVALLLNVCVLAFFLLQVHGRQHRVRVSMSESLDSLAGGGPTVEVAAGEIRLNNEVIAPDDLVIRLQGAPGNNSTLILRADADLPSERLAEIMRSCNRAGYTNIALEIEPPGAGGKSSSNTGASQP